MKKSEQAAEYFCDNRYNFIEMALQKIWQFTVELKKAMKVRIISIVNAIVLKFEQVHVVIP